MRPDHLKRLGGLSRLSGSGQREAGEKEERETVSHDYERVWMTRRISE
jgi:hypothetical protein